MKILCIGDPHFKISNVLNMTEFSDKCLEVIKNEDPDLVVILGDTLDRHETMHLIPHTMASKFISGISVSLKKELILIVGNHDRMNNSVFMTDESPFYLARHVPRVHYADKTILINFRGYTFVATPYVPVGRFQEALDTITSWKSADVIFAHQEIRGCALKPDPKNEKQFSSTGDPWLPEYPLLITGHIHGYQVLQENVIYPGTPLMHDFGDTQDKALLLLTLPDKQVQRIPLGLSKKISKNMTCSELSSFSEIEITEFLKKYTGEHLRLILSGTKEEHITLQDHPILKSLKNSGRCKIKTHLIQDPKAEGLEKSKENRPFSRETFSSRLQSKLSPELKKILENLN